MVNRGKIFIKLGQKFISLPLSGKILKKGDHEGGLFFIGYVKGKTARSPLIAGVPAKKVKEYKRGEKRC